MVKVEIRLIEKFVENRAMTTLLQETPRGLKECARSFEHDIRALSSQFSLPRMILKAAGQDHNLRMKMLEFIDVLPSLSSTNDVCEHFKMLVLPHVNSLPLPLRYGSYSMAIPLVRSLGTHAATWLIYKKLAPYFIVEKEKQLMSLQKQYRDEGAHISVDFLGESVTSRKEADTFFGYYYSALQKHKGPPGEFHISVKFSALYPFFGPDNYRESVEEVSRRFEHILRRAKKNGASVTIDAEQYSFRHLIEDIFCEVISRKEFRDMDTVGIALQAYRKDAINSAHRFVDVGKARGTPFSIRLVKGAYWDTEVAIAEQNNWPIPLFQMKEHTDRNFNHIFNFLISNWEYAHVSPATHNPENIAHAYLMARELRILLKKHFTFQTLYGLGDPVRKALCARKLPALVYTPVGNVFVGMSYLARRILENTSNEGFLFTLL